MSNLAYKKTPFCRKQKGLVLTAERVRDSIQLFVVSDEDEPPIPPEIRLTLIGRHATIDGFLLVIHREKFLRTPSLEIGANGEDIQVVRYHEDGLPGEITNQSTEEVTVTRPDIRNIFTLREAIPIAPFDFPQTALLGMQSAVNLPIIVEEGESVFLFTDPLFFIDIHTFEFRSPLLQPSQGIPRPLIR